MKFAERQPFSTSDNAKNGSKIANHNSLKVLLSLSVLYLFNTHGPMTMLILSHDDVMVLFITDATIICPIS